MRSKVHVVDLKREINKSVKHRRRRIQNSYSGRIFGKPGADESGQCPAPKSWRTELIDPVPLVPSGFRSLATRVHRGATTLFERVWPFLDHLSGPQWADYGPFVIHGYGWPLATRDPVVIDKLRNASNASEPRRQPVFDLFRDSYAARDFKEPKIPQISGDVDGGKVLVPNTNLSVAKSTVWTPSTVSSRPVPG